MLAMLGALACALIAWSLDRNGGHYEPEALGLLLAALGLIVAATTLRCSPELDRKCANVAIILFVPMLAWEVYHLPLRTVTGPIFLMAGLVSLAYLANLRSRFLFPCVLLFFAVATGLSLRVARPPEIDVWYFQRYAAEHLLEGRNPYSQTYPSIYDHNRFYGEKLLVEGRVRSFPYPPASLALVTPGRLAGDVRWSLWLALLGASALLVAAARQLGLPAGHPGELIAVAVLLCPLNLHMLGQAWTETLLALSVAFLFWTYAPGRGGLTWLAAAAVLAMKQYALLILLPFWLSGKLGLRQTLLAGAAALLTALPFLLWDFEGFVWGTIWFHVHNIFRPDALSVPAHLFQVAQWEAPGWLAFAAAAVFALIANLGPRESPAHSAMSAAGILLVFFLFNKNAFFNYYWLVLFLVASACLLDVARHVANPTAEGTASP